jgi:hypothetical protein
VRHEAPWFGRSQHTKTKQTGLLQRYRAGYHKKKFKNQIESMKIVKNHQFLSCLTALAMATTGMGPASALPYMGPLYYGIAHGLRHYPCQVVIALD